MRLIFYDTETTGLKAKNDRVIELAAYDATRDKTFETLIDPGMPIPPEASNIHGITDDKVKGAPTFKSVAAEFAAFCEGEVLLVAHNNDAFDIHFMRAEYERAEHPFPAWKFLDSLKWARRYRPDLPRHTLQFLREVYGIPENRAHRALDDVIVLKEVFFNMVDDLSPQQIYDLLNKPRPLQHMPFGKYQGKLLKELPKDYLQWLKGSGAFEKPENQELKSSLELIGAL
jgi:DNA polymerase-3 subunit epsilon